MEDPKTPMNDNPESTPKPANEKTLKWVAIVVVIILVLVFLGRILAPVLEDTIDFMRDSPIGLLIYFLLYTVLTVAAIPASILTIASGFIWGTFLGTAATVISATSGATAAYFVGKYFFRARVEEVIKRDYPTFHALDRAIERDGFRIIFFLRLSPLMPFSVGSYGMATTAVKPMGYILGTMFGIIPGSTLYCSIGAGLASLSEPREQTVAERIFFIVGLLVTIAVVVYLVKLGKREVAKAVAEGEKEMEGKKPDAVETA